MLLYKSLKEHYVKDEKTPALLYMGKSFSYGAMYKGIDEAAGKLAAFVKSGDVATICMPNTPECVYCFYALSRLGVIAHMVHPLAPLNQVKKFMAAAKSKLLVTLSVNLERYSPLAADYTIISVHPARSLSPILRLAFDIKNGRYKGERTNIADYSALPVLPLPPEPVRSSALTGVYLHSGGTGGEPKIIELSDDAINALANRGLEALCSTDARGKYMLGALPMFHGFGLTMSIHSILTYGGTSVLMPKFDPVLTVKLLKKNKMHFIIGVPNLFRSLLKQKDFCGDALNNMYVGFVGGDCAPQDLLDEFNGRMESAGARARLFEGYGLTETVTVCAVNNYDHNRRGSMGYMLSGLSAIVVDPDGTTPLAPGERGEFAISGDTVMNGYLDNPEENGKAFFECGGKKYVRTGDFGYMDEDGYLYYIQRLKRIIKISGISVYPKEIETSACELAGVTGACAVEYKSKGKTRIALYLTGEPQDEAAVKSKIEADLSRYAVPTIVKTIDEIPMTPVMKADTRALTRLAEGSEDA